MKMKTRYKRILGLFVLTFIILFGGTISVFAESCASKMKSIHDKPDYWANRYGVSIDYDASKDQYKVSMKKEMESGVSISKIKIKEFKTFNTLDEETGSKTFEGSVSYTKDEDIKKYIKSGKTTLTPGSSVYVDRSVVSGSRTGLQVILVPEDIKDSDWDSCGIYDELAINLYIELDAFGTGGTITGDISSSSDYSSIDYIDCTNYETFDHNGFNYKFCYAKVKAQEANRAYDFGKINNGDEIGLSYEKKWGKNDPFKFKCDYKAVVDSQDSSVLNDDSKYYIEENRKYIYGKAEFDISAGTYVYNYESGRKTEDAKCTITCEESVVVEYGPPVASKAGLCFQYKVKVTSRVSCQQKEGGANKPKDAKWCLPSPYCIHSDGTTYKQGGPNEEFDTCVKKCDKGKYTDKCVNKCYKKVYGKKSSKTDTTLALYEARKLSDSDNDGIMDAPKYKYKDGKIVWDTGSAGTTRTVGSWLASINNYTSSTDSTWHKTYPWGCGTKANYVAYTDNGIPKKKSCTDNCYWIGSGCGSDTYLNKEQAQMDYDANVKIYDQLQETCKAAASCTSTTAEFTISVDYQKKGSAEVKQINFPYTSPNDKNKDELTSLGAKENIKNTSKADNTTIKQYDGCYKDENEKRWYQTEWTFPGTWINDKTYEISYKPVKTNGWSSYDKKFCIPLNAKDVNTKWWLYYYAKRYGSNSSYAANNGNYINGIEDCKTGTNKNSSNNSTSSCNYGSATFSSDDAKDITYNIHASTKYFGYFGWYINVDCFYALYDAFDCSNNSNNKQGDNTSKIKSNKTCAGDSEYRVRAVDLKNLFPSEDGSKLTSTDTTGRSPGYNWSEFATQNSKDTDYKSFPEKYTKWIQSKGYSVYSDQYLDYYIPLTKEEINKIKKSGKNYTDYKGKVDVNSVTNYKSDLIRSEIKGAKYPNGQALKCNNMKNYSSSECENVEEAK